MWAILTYILRGNIKLVLRGLVFPEPVPLFAASRLNSEGEATIMAQALIKERRQPLDIEMRIDLPTQEVTVGDEAALSTEPDNNADSLVLRGTALDALPEAPEELERALRTLAGPSEGGGIRVDGFSGSPVPPKSTIREIRINQNAFSAENDRPGFGGIDIVTRRRL